MTESDRAIYERVAPVVTRFASALVGRDEAPDLVSTVVLRVLSKRTLSSLEEAEPYLMKAVLNEARMHGRTQVRRDRAVARLGTPSPARDTADLATSSLTEAVMNLPVQQRAAVYLVYWCDFSPTEAAPLLGCRPGTIRRYLHLAMKKLREHAHD